ncbi:MAG: hypothetical protein P8X57_02580 [Cyclobacteriaceae bacterium]
MKTTYERLYDYDLTNVIVGKSKKKYYKFYFVLTILIILFGALITI